ncbi:MAG TPA: zinc ribbon domain-containing protein [Gaiellaceae bacterium]|nr:zinc ribbon domain-containing protein [Gaiellaceae bacterium]
MPETVACPGCGASVPAGAYCVRCGTRLAADGAVDHSLHPAGRRGFAAAPAEHRLEPRVVSTLFPHLPRAGMATFRAELAAGVALLAALALAGVYPLALVVSAVLVPLLVVLYFVAVDLYEDEPLRVLALTVAWGAAAGVGFGFLTKAVQGADAALVSRTASHSVVWNGILLPLIELALALAGPLVLLPYRRFNDVLDGVTFAGASAVALAGAALLTRSSTFLGSGLEPVGETTPWVLRLLTLGVGLPVLAAASVGAAAGSLWLRTRAPARDRRALGALGHPPVSLTLAAVALVGGALLQLFLGRWPALAALAALDLAVLVWLRQVIHVGLAEEARERDVGAPVACRNCGQETPEHTFCLRCGVALAALPKGSGQARARTHLAFAGGLCLLVGLGLAALLAARPGPVRPFCAGRRYCPGPPAPAAVAARAPALVTRRVWRSTHGFQLEYDGAAWSASAAGRRGVEGILLTSAGTLSGARLRVLVEVQPATAATPTALVASERSALRGLYPTLATDLAAYQPLTPSIGSVYGVGEADAATAADETGPVEAMIEAASADGVSVLVSAWTDNPRGLSGTDAPYPIFVLVDQILETVRWPSEPVP